MDDYEERLRKVELFLDTAVEAWSNLEQAIYEASEHRHREVLLVLTMISHTVIALALIVAYVVVTVTGNDGNLMLGILGGYLGGAVVTTTATRIPSPVRWNH